MRIAIALVITSLLSCGSAFAAERYTEARITQIEVSELNIMLFLSDISGDLPPSGNGGSNEPVVIKHSLFLANSAEDIAARKHILAAALVAQAQGTMVRFRWDDTGPSAYRFLVMLVRS
jgi:hypothetical protein